MCGGGGGRSAPSCFTKAHLLRNFAVTTPPIALAVAELRLRRAQRTRKRTNTDGGRGERSRRAAPTPRRPSLPHMRRIAAGVLLSCLPHTVMRGALATSSAAAALARRSRPSAAPLVRRGAGPAFVAGRGRAPPPPRRALPPPSRGRSSSAPGDARGPAPSLAARKSNDPEGRTDAAGSLLLDPTAPLRPLLAAGVGGENPLAGYALAPTILGTDDFRPELRVGQRVIAFGDVHGDLDALRTFLVAGGLLDPASPSEDPAWTGGDTIVVQTGDVLDRGDDEMACFRLLAALSRRAREAGGALLLLHGNHE